jgi:ABC transporter
MGRTPNLILIGNCVPPAWRFSEPAASSASPSGTENSDRIDDGTFEVVTFLGDEIRGLAKSFGGIRALSGVDVSIERGTVHGLIGPNGSGKSTFVNLVTGALRLTHEMAPIWRWHPSDTGKRSKAQ